MSGSRNDLYKLNYAKRKFTDEDLDLLPLRRGSYSYEEVDFSQNELSSDGLRVVLDLCRRCQKLRILKLFKNQIDDAGAEGLAKLCEQCPSIEEIHLSHNRFTGNGVERIVSAAERARPASAPPLWLRLEQNDVSDPNDLLHDMQSYLSVCEKIEKRCTNRTCCRGHKIHLPLFNIQKPWRNNSATREANAEDRGRRVVLTARTEVDPPARRQSPSRGSQVNYRNGDGRYARARDRYPSTGRRRVMSPRGERGGLPPRGNSRQWRNHASRRMDTRQEYPPRRRPRSPVARGTDRTPVKRRRLSADTRARLGRHQGERFQKPLESRPPFASHPAATTGRPPPGREIGGSRSASSASSASSSSSSHRGSSSHRAVTAGGAVAGSVVATAAANVGTVVAGVNANATARLGVTPIGGGTAAAVGGNDGGVGAAPGGEVVSKGSAAHGGARACSPEASLDEDSDGSFSSSRSNGKSGGGPATGSAAAANGKSVNDIAVAETGVASATEKRPPDEVQPQAPMPADGSPPPSPRSVNRSLPSSEPSRAGDAPHRWNQDREGSPPSHSRSRSPARDAGLAATQPRAKGESHEAEKNHAASDGGAGTDATGHPAPLEGPRTVKERMESLKEQLTQKWQGKPAPAQSQAEMQANPVNKDI